MMGNHRAQELLVGDSGLFPDEREESDAGGDRAADDQEITPLSWYIPRMTTSSRAIIGAVISPAMYT
jgi:hypothetical protein